MPPKLDATKTQVNNGPGKNGNGPNSGNDGSETGDGPTKEVQRSAAVPPAEIVPPTDDSNKSAHGNVPVADASAAEPAGRGPQDIEMEDASVKEKHGEARIAQLELQLQNAKGTNASLQRVIADYEKQLASGSGGTRKSLEERARDLGFGIDAYGNVQRGRPRQVFDVTKPTSTATDSSCECADDLRRSAANGDRNVGERRSERRRSGSGQSRICIGS